MEILENSLIRLISRQGADSDRKNVLLASGEFGYSTDLKKLYIGDGFTYGGTVVGNKFLGARADITTLSPAVSGDLAFDTDKNKLYQLALNDGHLLSDWRLIAGVYASSDDKLTISNTNVITMNLLSAYSLSNDLILSPITLSAGKIAINPLSSYSLSNDVIMSPITLTSGRLSLNPLSSYALSNDLILSPLTLSAGKMAINPLSSYSLSNDLVSGSIILTGGKLALSANIPYQSVSTKTVTISSGLRGFVDNVETTGIAFNPLSSNYIIQSNQLHAVYDGLSGQVLRYSRNMTVTRLSAGDYRFNYGPLPISNVYPIVNILGLDRLDCRARVVEMSNSSCSVYILSTNNILKTDANIALTISY